jgi:hypothetical protein
LAEVGKRYLVSVMAHNLGVILRTLIGVGKPREWASMRALLASLRCVWSTIVALALEPLRKIVDLAELIGRPLFGGRIHFVAAEKAATSTGC